MNTRRSKQKKRTERRVAQTQAHTQSKLGLRSCLQCRELLCVDGGHRRPVLLRELSALLRNRCDCPRRKLQGCGRRLGGIHTRLPRSLGTKEEKKRW